MQQRTKLRFHRVEDVAAYLFPGQKIETPSIWSVASSKLTDVNQTIRVSAGRATGKSDRGRDFFAGQCPLWPRRSAQAGFLTSATPLLTLKKNTKGERCIRPPCMRCMCNKIPVKTHSSQKFVGQTQIPCDANYPKDFHNTAVLLHGPIWPVRRGRRLQSPSSPACSESLLWTDGLPVNVGCDL